jgi:cobalt-zinc-cadmium efflux system outer membrane protein
MFKKNTRPHDRLVQLCRFLLTIGVLVPTPYIFAQTGAASRTSLSPALQMAAEGTGSSQTSQPELEGLLQLADSVNPAIRAARRGVDAARARVGPAGLPPDPMLMLGIQNLPLGKMQSASATPMTAAGPDPMTMRMIGIEQTLPYPGKLSLRRRAAEHEADAARASLEATTRQVVRDVKDAYYELAFVEQALLIVGRNRDVLAGFIRVTETRYAVGTAGQQDILKARVEATRLAETAVTLTEQRHAVVARLNALLDRSSDTPIDDAEIPASVSRAAVPIAATDIRFTSAALGARAADSPLPPLAELQESAIRQNSEIRKREAMIAAQTSRLGLARKDALPDFDLSLQYGQRGGGLPDMITALVSVPIPVFKARKQNQLVAEASAQLASLEAGRSQKQNEIHADVARLVSELERSRAQLALYVKALLPQARASLSSATASYQVGRVEFLTVLDDQATVFNYETEYFRVLSDFARNLAELERVVGKEILQ